MEANLSISKGLGIGYLCFSHYHEEVGELKTPLQSIYTTPGQELKACGHVFQIPKWIA